MNARLSYVKMYSRLRSMFFTCLAFSVHFFLFGGLEPWFSMGGNPHLTLRPWGGGGGQPDAQDSSHWDWLPGLLLEFLRREPLSEDLKQESCMSVVSEGHRRLTACLGVEPRLVESNA